MLLLVACPILPLYQYYGIMLNGACNKGVREQAICNHLQPGLWFLDFEPDMKC